eukprot:scaffold28989_cov133-Isochrysis_galbana.AAC.2
MHTHHDDPCAPHPHTRDATCTIGERARSLRSFPAAASTFPTKGYGLHTTLFGPFTIIHSARGARPAHRLGRAATTETESVGT